MILGIGMAAFTVFALAILSTSSRLQDASWRQCATLFGSNTRHFGKNSHNDGKTESVVAGRYKRLRSNGNWDSFLNMVESFDANTCCHWPFFSYDCSGTYIVWTKRGSACFKWKPLWRYLWMVAPSTASSTYWANSNFIEIITKFFC